MDTSQESVQYSAYTCIVHDWAQSKYASIISEKYVIGGILPGIKDAKFSLEES